MRAVISVVGRDRPGILAFAANECAVRNINIEDVTQKVLQDLFTMIMIVEIPDDIGDFSEIITHNSIFRFDKHINVLAGHTQKSLVFGGVRIIANDNLPITDV